MKGIINRDRERARLKKCQHKFHFINILEGIKDKKYWKSAQFVCEKCGLIRFVKTKDEKNKNL